MYLRGRMPPVWQGGLIVLLVLLAYLPAMRGGLVWDDDSWTTNLSALFQNASGLWSIWCNPNALQQYYPLTGTTFWIDYHLWGFWTFPYHVENVLLHALAALLFWRLLLRLQLPGAWLAAALFALHPVMVESAAWITERKNVLSLALYLGALLAYERFAPWVTNDQQPTTGTIASVPDRGRFYNLALLLFLAALLAKTTAFSLPVTILLLTWWKRGRLWWRADVLPTLRFFTLAIGFCALTAWLEKNHVGAQGSDFALNFPQRCLAAGHAFWFYLGKLLWPANLCFLYPRWQFDTSAWWQWLYPVTATGILFALWLGRGPLGRGPVTAAFFYLVTLFPVLGFMNAYGMRYSFVWDHWVYLSSLGPLALVAALVAGTAGRLRSPVVLYGFAAVVLPVLMLLTWRQSGMYTNMETLWRTTITRNPDAFLAYNNLGSALQIDGKIDKAIKLYRKAIQINPAYFEAQYNLGLALATVGQHAEAIEHYRKAIQIGGPACFRALNSLGVSLAAQGHWDEAIENYRKSIQLYPNFPEAQSNLANALAARQRSDEIENYRQALKLKPDDADARFNLSSALAQAGQVEEAVAQYRQALELNPDLVGALNNLAWILATSSNDRLRNGPEAVRLSEHACELTQYREPLLIGTLAAAYAEAGRFPEAVATAEKAAQLATTAGSGELAEKNRQLLELYRAGKPYHEPPPTGQ